MSQGQRHEVQQGQALVCQNNPVLGEERLENGPAERAEHEPEHMPSRPRGQLASWLVKEIVWPAESVISPLYLLLVRLHLESISFSSGSLIKRRTFRCGSEAREMALKLMKCLEPKSYEEKQIGLLACLAWRKRDSGGPYHCLQQHKRSRGSHSFPK